MFHDNKRNFHSYDKMSPKAISNMASLMFVNVYLISDYENIMQAVYIIIGTKGTITYIL